ncbi:putative ML domain protein [Basidiobolus meristosporus CBS 931.73]|uniref:Phosphatidylglycerol/phosphatidylinositol transfer protein n=1 Tax=Basidiobolus meristosporus CBS 931.73 TaxID=1314790 RepID=A0A1Y1Y0G0_9FUNG|nr:putative ML domain protein [Basidiobolus meristosporus CBS 931.73]|eukprot:ORX91503.1 putative ML domain protein [Basidiobolus meristosporus CBS 931.73]
MKLFPLTLAILACLSLATADLKLQEEALLEDVYLEEQSYDSPLGRPLGDSLYDCGSPSDLLKINYVNISPDPPHKGQKLRIQGEGVFSDKVEEGSYAVVSVKYGRIRLLQLKFDTCKEIKQIDKECPLGPGPQSIDAEVDLPKEIPPGRYTAHAQVYTKDGRQIACVNGLVKF